MSDTTVVKDYHYKSVMTVMKGLLRILRELAKCPRACEGCKSNIAQAIDWIAEVMPID